jgi:hypothetical protein
VGKIPHQIVEIGFNKRGNPRYKSAARAFITSKIKIFASFHFIVVVNLMLGCG